MGILLDPNRCLPPHPSDEILEDYALSRLPEASRRPRRRTPSDLPPLPGCGSGNGRVRGRLEGARLANRLSRWSVLPKLSRLSTGSMSLAPALILSLVALLAVWNHPAQEPSAPVAVNLSSMRGLSPLAPAPAGKPLRLSIDLPDLVSTGSTASRWWMRPEARSGRERRRISTGNWSRRCPSRSETACTGSGCTANTRNYFANLACRRSNVRA